MALIKMSGIGVTELSGKFGGSVGSRNKSGAVLRNRVKGTNARTNKQIVQRGSFSATAASWRGLTAAERLAWNMAAQSGEWPYQNRLGESRNPTGSQLFNRLNDNLALFERTPITEPPLKIAAPTLVMTGFIFDVSAQTIDITFTGSYVGFDILLDSTGATSTGVDNSSFFRRLASAWDNEADSTYERWVDVFGTPIIGGKVTLRASAVSQTTGQSFVIAKMSNVIQA